MILKYLYDNKKQTMQEIAIFSGLTTGTVQYALGVVNKLIAENEYYTNIYNSFTTVLKERYNKANINRFV